MVRTGLYEWTIRYGVEITALKIGAKSATSLASTTAKAASGAGKVATGASTKLPKQIHHFATNKHSFYSKQMEAIAKQYGLELEGAWNKAGMPHLGRHPNAYHDFVSKGMQGASIGAGGNQVKFLQLFDQYVKQPVLQNPDLLREIGW